MRTVTSCALLDGSPSRRGWQLREIVNEGDSENKLHWTRRRLLCNLNTGSWHSESPIPDVMTGIGMEAGYASPHAHLPAGLNPPGLAMTARAH